MIEPDLCNAMRVPKIVRSPFYMFAPLFRTTVPNSLIHHVCSIIGHAKSETKQMARKGHNRSISGGKNQANQPGRPRPPNRVVHGGCSESTGSLNFCRASSTQNSRRSSPASTRRTGTVLARPFDTLGGGSCGSPFLNLETE